MEVDEERICSCLSLEKYQRIGGDRPTKPQRTYEVSLERRELEEGVREMVERISDPGLQKSQALHGDGEVVVVPREIFTRFGIAVSFSLRYSHEQGNGKEEEGTHRWSGSVHG